MKYINEVRQASDVNRISIMSLYGKSVNEQTGYSDSLFYLTSKNKVGVVNNFRGCLKDVYLVPLRGKIILLKQKVFIESYYMNHII